MSYNNKYVIKHHLNNYTDNILVIVRDKNLKVVSTHHSPVQQVPPDVEAQPPASSPACGTVTSRPRRRLRPPAGETVFSSSLTKP